MLRKGNPWHTFVAGILLSFPGVSYLAALDRLIHLHYSTFVTVVIVVGFCLVQNLLLEIPMLAFKIWPTETPAAIDSAKAWGARHGRQYGAWGLAILGVGAGDHKRHRPPIAMTWAGGFRIRQRLRGSLWALPLLGGVLGAGLAAVDVVVKSIRLPAAWTYRLARASGFCTPASV